MHSSCRAKLLPGRRRRRAIVFIEGQCKQFSAVVGRKLIVHDEPGRKRVLEETDIAESTIKQSLAYRGLEAIDVHVLGILVEIHECESIDKCIVDSLCQIHTRVRIYHLRQCPIHDIRGLDQQRPFGFSFRRCAPRSVGRAGRGAGAQCNAEHRNDNNSVAFTSYRRHFHQNPNHP